MKRIQILFVTNNFVYNLVPIRRKFNLINDFETKINSQEPTPLVENNSNGKMKFEPLILTVQ